MVLLLDGMQEDKDAYWKADCLHKPHVTKALSKDHLPAETMTIGIGADAVEVKEHTFWGKLIGWRFKSAEALTKAVDKDFGFVVSLCFPCALLTSRSGPLSNAGSDHEPAGGRSG